MITSISSFLHEPPATTSTQYIFFQQMKRIDIGIPGMVMYVLDLNMYLHYIVLLGMKELIIFISVALFATHKIALLS